MLCPSCKETTKNVVINSRPRAGGRVIRRQRRCVECGVSFKTYETTKARWGRQLDCVGAERGR